MWKEIRTNCNQKVCDIKSKIKVEKKQEEEEEYEGVKACISSRLIL